MGDAPDAPLPSPSIPDDLTDPLLESDDELKMEEELEETVLGESSKFLSSISRKDILRQQLNDPVLATVIRVLLNDGTSPKVLPVKWQTLIKRGLLKVDEQQMLYRKPFKENPLSRNDLFVVPPSLRRPLIDHYHESLLEGSHRGVRATDRKIRERFYWPGSLTSVRSRLRYCTKCQKGKKDPRADKQGLPIPNISDRPGQMVQADSFGPMPETTSGHQLWHHSDRHF